MRKFILIIFVTTLSAQTHARLNSQKIVLKCSLNHIPQAKIWIADQHYNSFDKFKHCGVSCYLSLRCNRGEVGLVGILKEVWDAFGPGNAEFADMKADFYGISLVKKKIAINDEECARECDEHFPMP
jgi:hypothetical protein